MSIFTKLYLALLAAFLIAVGVMALHINGVF